MTNLLKTNALLCGVLLALTACGGGSVSGGNGGSSSGSNTTTEPNPTSLPTSPNLVVGESNYVATCSGCHGSSGEDILRPLDPFNCQVADCSSVDSLASYIDTFMPPTAPMVCNLIGDDSCALTTAAYLLNGFSTEVASVPTEPVAPTESPGINVQSPLARLTNDEYVNSVRTLLSLPGDSPKIDAAKTSLASESSVKGLTNDASTQTITQLTISGYSTMAIAASDDFLSTVTSKDELEILLGCPTISNTKVCVEEFSNNLLTKAYRRPSTADDAANISKVYNSILALNQEAGNEIWDIAAHKTTLQSIIQFIMLSPEFLLVVENGKPANSNATEKELTDLEIATRMALFLAGTLPDDLLIADANAGLLGDAEVRLQHAERLMNSDIGVKQTTTLLSNWLGIDHTFAETADIDAVSAFISNWFVNEGQFSDLYQGPVTVDHIDGTQTTEPLGILGLRAFVASHTSFPTPSFINRGAFVVERLLCQALPDGLPDAALDAGELTPLEVFEVHDQQACATCHKVFDNYGAAFQQFDAETALFNPAAQDFGGSFDLYEIGDINTTVSTLGDLSYSMASSQRASSCMAELWYRHSMRRSIDVEGNDEDKIDALVNTWSESDEKSMKSLLRSVIASDSFITLFL